MQERIIKRYSVAFKREVVAALESGRFASVGEANAHYGITGATTIKHWLKRFGRSHLAAKVVRVEKPDEANQILELKRRIADLERALGQTQAQSLLNQQYLKLACDRMGQDIESFKKKCAGKPSTGQ